MPRRSIIVSSRADADIERLKSFLFGEDPFAAQRAVERIISGIDKLADFPNMGRPSGRHARLLNLRYGKSGYAVRYRITNDSIIILRLWHGKEQRR